jgi:hypothetical protein
MAGTTILRYGTYYHARIERTGSRVHLIGNNNQALCGAGKSSPALKITGPVTCRRCQALIARDLCAGQSCKNGEKL